MFFTTVEQEDDPRHWLEVIQWADMIGVTTQGFGNAVIWFSQPQVFTGLLSFFFFSFVQCFFDIIELAAFNSWFRRFLDKVGLRKLDPEKMSLLGKLKQELEVGKNRTFLSFSFFSFE
jgi:hypothetical protein